MSDHPAIDKMIADAVEQASNPKPKLADMMMAVTFEALNLEMSQRAFLIAALRSEPSAAEIKRIALLRSTARFLDACLYQPNEVAKRLSKKKA